MKYDWSGKEPPLTDRPFRERLLRAYQVLTCALLSSLHDRNGLIYKCDGLLLTLVLMVRVSIVVTSTRFDRESLVWKWQSLAGTPLRHLNGISQGMPWLVSRCARLCYGLIGLNTLTTLYLTGIYTHCNMSTIRYIMVVTSQMILGALHTASSLHIHDFKVSPRRIPEDIRIYLCLLDHTPHVTSRDSSNKSPWAYRRSVSCKG